MAVIILGMLGSGLYMVGLTWGDEKQNFYFLHKSVGLVILMLIVMRILVRTYTSVPYQDKTLLGKLASFAHFGLYVLMLSMPFSGVVMSWAGGHDIPFFSWFSIAGASEKLPEVASFANRTHEILGYCFLALIGLHILGFLVHWLIKKENRLERMTLRF